MERAREVVTISDEWLSNDLIIDNSNNSLLCRLPDYAEEDG